MQQQDTTQREEIKKIYTPGEIRQIKERQILTLMKDCANYRREMKFAELCPEEMKIAALKVYIYSLRRRLKSKIKRGVYNG